MTTKTKLFRGENWSDVMQEIENEYEDMEIVETNIVRRIPYFWKKEWHVRVMGLPKSHSITPVKTTAPIDNNQKMLLDILEGNMGSSAKPEPENVAEEQEDIRAVEDAIAHIAKTLKEENEIIKGFYEKLIDSEVESSIAKSIVDEIEEELSPVDRQNAEAIEQKLLEKMGLMLGVTGPIDLQNIKTIALIGPTGVGKTTTVAKISGILRSYNKRIGLITTDVYRIGATDQLQIYANILDCKMIAVTNPDELVAAIDYFRNVERVDQILIDTVGRSPLNMELVDDMKTYIDIAEPDHTALVLSSTQKYSDIQKILQNFSHIDINSVIFTKMDETLSYGNMLNVANRSKLKVSYVTDGQNVPQDIYVATPEALAKKILTGVSDFGSSIITA